MYYYNCNENSDLICYKNGGYYNNLIKVFVIYICITVPIIPFIINLTYCIPRQFEWDEIFNETNGITNDRNANNLASKDSKGAASENET